MIKDKYFKARMPANKCPKCPFIDCFYGMGLAGTGICDGYGDWEDPECPKYENDDEVWKKWECEGACEQHDSLIMLVKVFDPKNKKDWGLYHYCSTAIETDRNNGFIVEILKG